MDRKKKRESEERLQGLHATYKQAQSCREQIWESFAEMALRIARSYAKRYHWIIAEDLSQSMLLKIPELIETYKANGKNGTSLEKYVYHRLYYVAKDRLRQEDPLGIRWPQREHYPEFCHLQDPSLSGFDREEEQEPEEYLDDDEFNQSLAEVRELFRKSRPVEPLPSCKFRPKKKYTTGLGRFMRRQLTLFE